MNRLLILIPAFNEAQSIDALVRAVRGLTLPVPADVLVVNDGSTDDTAAMARAAGATVLTLVQNLGYGNALRAGYEFARRSEYDTIVQLDGDGQHAPESIPALLRALMDNEADLVLGSRFHADSNYRVTGARRLGQRLFSSLLLQLGGQRIDDVTSGFQVIGPRAFQLYLSDDFPSDYPDANVLLFLLLNGLRIKEAPAEFRMRAAGVSMHRGLWRPLFYIYKMLFSMLLIYLRFRWMKKKGTQPS